MLGSRIVCRGPTTATCSTLCYSFQELLLIIIRDPNAHDVCTWASLDIWHISCIQFYRLVILLLVLQSLVTYHCPPYVSTSFLAFTHLHNSLPSLVSLATCFPPLCASAHAKTAALNCARYIQVMNVKNYISEYKINKQTYVNQK